MTKLNESTIEHHAITLFKVLSCSHESLIAGHGFYFFHISVDSGGCN